MRGGAQLLPKGDRSGLVDKQDFGGGRSGLNMHVADYLHTPPLAVCIASVACRNGVKKIIIFCQTPQCVASHLGCGVCDTPVAFKVLELRQSMSLGRECGLHVQSEDFP